MKEELAAEAGSESETYDKMVCWCETNEKEKSQAVKDTDAKDVALVSDIKGRSARFGELSTEISQLKAQIADDTESLKKATALREGAAATARGDDKSLTQAITNLRNAIAVLSKHHGSLLQLSAPLVSSLQVLLRDVGSRYSALVASQARHAGEAADEPQASLLALGEQTQRAGEQARQGRVGRVLLGALMGRTADIPDVPLDMAEHLIAKSAKASRGAGSSGVFLQVVEGKPQSYSAHSGQILGILKRLLSEFEAQLGLTKTDDGQASARHQELADAKGQQIEVAKQKLDDLETDAASNQKALSDAKEDLDATRKQRTADVDFLRNLKTSCSDLDADWERRSKTRSEELKAVAEAISILTEDDNRETLSRSLSLLQQRMGTSATATARRARAAALLRRAASDTSLDMDDLLSSWRGHRQGDSTGLPASAPAGAGGGPRTRLSALAAAVRIDSFKEVKDMIDKMVAQLKDQQKEDAKLKAYCVKELAANEKAALKKSDEEKDLESKLDSLEDTVKTLEEEIGDAKAQISQTQTEVKKAGGAREKENAEFQTTVADQRATQTILKKALLRLQDFYSKGIGNQAAAPSLLQRAAQTPPAQFTAYKTNAGASPVITLLTQILEDSKNLEADAVSGEQRAQADYEAFVKDSNAVVQQLSDTIAFKIDAKASAKMEAAETESGLESAKTELASLSAYEVDLHNQCDFLLANFDIRQKARLQEMEAIQSAKAILSGAGR